MALMLVLLLMAAAAVLLYATPKPQPVKVRRNLLQEELLARYRQEDSRF